MANILTKVTNFFTGQKDFNPILYDVLPRSYRNTHFTYDDYSNQTYIDTVYESSTYFAVCLNYITDQVKRVPLIVQKKNENGQWESYNDSALAELIRKPHPRLTMSDLIKRVVGNEIMSGNEVWGKVRSNGVPVELWPVPIDKLYMRKSRTRFIDHYTYAGDHKEKKIIPAEDIVHFSRIGYEDIYWGEGEIKVAKRLFEFEQKSIEWNLEILENQGITPGILGVKDRLTPAQLDHLRNQLKERRIGGLDAGTDLVIGADMTYQKIGLSSDDIAWIEGRKMTRDDIFMLLRVPIQLVASHLGAVSDIETVRATFWEDRIMPIMENIEATIALQLTPEFEDPKDVRVVFDRSKIKVYSDQLFRDGKAVNVFVQNGFAPRAVAKMLDLPVDEKDIIPGFLKKPEYNPDEEGNDQIASQNENQAVRMGEEIGMRDDRPSEIAEEPDTEEEEGLMQAASAMFNIQKKLIKFGDKDKVRQSQDFWRTFFKYKNEELYEKIGEQNIDMLNHYFKNCDQLGINYNNPKMLDTFFKEMRIHFKKILEN